MYSSSEGIDGKTDGSMYGHACASNCVAVAAMGWVSAIQLVYSRVNACILRLESNRYP